MGLASRANLATAGLLMAAALAALLAPPAPRRAPAQGDRVVLPFAARGAQGPIEGVVIVEADHIVEVVVTRSDEGIDRRALTADRLGARFRGRPATPPLAVDAISGATISSARLIEAVEARLRRWREHARAR